MTRQTNDGIESCRASFSGQALTPGDPDYDRSRAIWNGAIDRKPAVIACCTSADLVAVADSIRFARQGGLQISIRGGGHSYAGNSVCDGGLMVRHHAGDTGQIDPMHAVAYCPASIMQSDPTAVHRQPWDSRRQ